ncbi:MAG: SseB family protein, partial [Selenomonadaceae bacterium]|nr:SseB family protein [Selenomonadaceae bacterium]
FFDAGADSFKDTVAKMNAGENIFPAVGGDPTSVNLVKLFEILGRDITQPCEDVFFTNFCLGYRLGNNGGGMTKKLMMRDAELFRELCEILEPENILCLGKITSECVYETLTGEKFAKASGDGTYNDFLDNRPQIVLQYGANSELTSNFYPLAHCGGMGTAMRPLDKQREDWLKIADEIPLDAPTEWWWKKNPAEGEELAENTRLAVAVAGSLNELDGQKSWNDFLAALSSCSKAGGYVLVPVYSAGKTFQPDDFQFSFMENLDGEKVLEIFATRADIAAVRSVSSGKAKVLIVEMREFFKKFLDGDIPCKEMLLNICGKNMVLTRETILSL